MSHPSSDFLDRLKRSGLLSAERLPNAESLHDSGAITDASLATDFVGRKLLTQYQADKLLADEGSSLLIADRYEVREQLGAGGMGEVYLARDRQLDRDVAIKVLPARLVPDPDAVARFEREAKAMARLSHPNIVQAFDAGSDGERHFLVMEHVDGANLSQRLRDAGKIDAPIAADFAYQAALGLEHAHGKGLIHRDLKPSNLLVTQDGTVKVLDLGLAKFAQDQIDDESITMAGAGLGTPDYMAPEQFADAKNADERSDVYALGCTLYHMLTGRVPFPGSSLSEKQRAHQKDAPDPVEQHAPFVPAGLSQAVLKMMAKKPAERFQTARDCAEALTPYVAASSASLANLNATVDWEGSRLTIVTSGRRRRRLAKWGTFATALVLLSSGLGFGVAQFFNGGDEDGSSDRNPRLAAIDPGKSAANGKTPKSQEPPPVKSNGGKRGGTLKKSPKKQLPVTKPDPWVLTVAQDGSGQFKSIAAAKDSGKLKPGMTIRILDSETYVETVDFTDSRRHAGVTLEGVRNPILKVPEGERFGIVIDGVPDVQIRNLMIEGNSMKGPHSSYYLIGIGNASPGVTIQRVKLRGRFPRGGKVQIGVGIEGVDLKATQDPVVVTGCSFERLSMPLRLSGATVEGEVIERAKVTPNPLRRVVIRGNRIENGIAIWAAGELSDIQFVGNRIFDCLLQVGALLPGSGRILIANNTIDAQQSCLKFDGPVNRTKGIHICNNLLLSKFGPDIGYFGREPGGLKQLKVGNNVRWTAEPGKPGVATNMVRSADDVFVKEVRLESRDPKDDATYLRPASDWEAAREGAGNTDPALPTYVGALPPKDTPAWDWDRTWRMPPGEHKVLTVSKDAKGGGKYRTINAALKDVKPWDTIRVLDDAEYRESVYLQLRHAGISIEAPRGAVIVPAGNGSAFRVVGTPNVTIRGFRLRAENPQSYLVLIGLKSPGAILEDLTLEAVGSAANEYIAIDIETLTLTRKDDPIVVRNCSIARAGMGVRISGLDNDGKTGIPAGRVVVHDNLIQDCSLGVKVAGSIFDCQLLGNRFSGSSLSAIQFQTVLSESRNALVANNSIVGSVCAFQLWDTAVHGNGLELAGNLLLAGDGVDMLALDGLPDSTTPRGAGDVSSFLKVWRCRNNWREVQVPTGSTVFERSWIPVAPADNRRDKIAVASRDPSKPDFLRPDGESPLATGGAGGDLPRYAGAVPPKGAKPWDWSVTWRSRRMRAKYSKTTKPTSDDPSPKSEAP